MLRIFSAIVCCHYTMHFICPLCREPLITTAQGASCIHRHHFDRAKEGYLNLLPVQQKKSREPGDAKAQLRARREFLAAGYFAPLIAPLCELIPPATQTLLDIGCGEGYFTHALQQHLSASALVYGIDIAREGIKLAAKKYQGCYAVASSFALPLADHSMQVITRIYAPDCDAELQRVLAQDGQVIIVAPAANHLLGLRKLIYQDVRPHLPPPPPTKFTERHTRRVSFSLSIPAGPMTEALLQMTPFSWRLTAPLRQELIATGLEDEVDFYLSAYIRSE